MKCKDCKWFKKQTELKTETVYSNQDNSLYSYPTLGIKQFFTDVGYCHYNPHHIMKEENDFCSKFTTQSTDKDFGSETRV
jgi:hypothetical protein